MHPKVVDGRPSQSVARSSSAVTAHACTLFGAGLVVWVIVRLDSFTIVEALAVLGVGPFVVALLRRLGVTVDRGLLTIPALVAGVSLSVAARYAILSEGRAELGLATDIEAGSLKFEIETSVDDDMRALQRMASRWTARGGTPRAEWEADATHYLADMFGVRTLGWVDSTGTLRWQMPPHDSALARALKPVLARAGDASPVSGGENGLASLVEDGLGWLVRMPLSAGSFNGFLVTLTALDEVLPRVVREAEVHGYDVSIRDLAGRTVYQTAAANPPEAGLVARQVLDLGSLRLELRVWPRAALARHSSHAIGNIAVVLGLLMSSLAATAGWTAVRARRRALEAASANAALHAETAEHRRTALALTEAERRARDLYHRSPDMQVSLDFTGRILECNETFARTIGRARGELLGASMAEFYLPPHREALRRTLDRLRSADLEVRDLRTALKTTRGAVLEVSVNAMRVSDLSNSGEEAGCRVTLRDVGDQQRLQRELARVNAARRAVGRRYRHLVHGALVGVYTLQNERFVYVNPRMSTITGYSQDQLLGLSSVLEIVAPGDRDRVSRALKGGLGGMDRDLTQAIRIVRRDGVIVHVETFVGRIRHRGEPALIGGVLDVTERVALQAQLQASQKLESIGQLAAGIAHEINTPTQFVGDNLTFLGEAWRGLDPLFALVEQISQAGSDQADQGRRLVQALDAADLEYLREEVPRAIAQSSDGVQRVAEIVRAMKEFAHPGTPDKALVNLNRAIETTIIVARNELKYVADVRTDLDDQLPLVPCLPGEMNQVLLNLLVNAAHAIAAVVGPQPEHKGTITVTTRRANEWVELRVADTGGGVPAEIQARIFDPFFTTKEVGKGTGQGLALAHNVVVRKHGGRLWCESAPNAGATFVLRLPLASASDGTGTAA